ncbi:MAG: IS256 family transposase, partial [Candidatus Bathyarchaeota archaeon]|nr:IS256 family transposase [Candidatus Bathyarchaeota archaeon]
MAKKKRVDRPNLEDLIPDPKKREEILSRLYRGDPILGDGGIFTDMLQTLVNAALEGEMDQHLSTTTPSGQGNRRNGHTHKIVRSTAGPLEVHTPRDRDGDHDPILIKKWERELGSGLDDIILSLYARGQSVEDIRHQLRRLYGIEVSAGVISSVTDRVWTEIVQWQERMLAPCQVIVYLDAIHYKVREAGQIISKAVYTVYGVDVHGERDVLGLYLSDNEGSRQWGLILEDIKRRGVEDVLFFCVDGLKGFKEVIDQVYPQSLIQRCIVHMVRTSTRFVSDRDIKAVCSDLRKIYSSADRNQASVALESFGQKWDAKYPEIKPKWEENWTELMAFMDYSSNVRRMIYTTNPVEALHRIMRKVTKTKGAWVNDKGLLKQLYLALKYNEKSWKRRA